MPFQGPIPLLGVHSQCVLIESLCTGPMPPLRREVEQISAQSLICLRPKRSFTGEPLSGQISQSWITWDLPDDQRSVELGSGLRSHLGVAVEPISARLMLRSFRHASVQLSNHRRDLEPSCFLVNGRCSVELGDGSGSSFVQSDEHVSVKIGLGTSRCLAREQRCLEDVQLNAQLSKRGRSSLSLAMEKVVKCVTPSDLDPPWSLEDGKLRWRRSLFLGRSGWRSIRCTR